MQQNSKSFKPFLLKQISKLSSPNQKIPLLEICSLYPEHELPTKGFYFPYNEKYEDLGWGCAWRAIQTILSVQDIESDFKELVEKERKRDRLLDIWGKNRGKKAKGKLEDVYGWAPQENQNCWAEPFIGELICNSKGLKTHLSLVNGYPKSYVPELVYEQCLNFKQFWSFIIKYIPSSSIMVDDGQTALSIIGYKDLGNGQKSIILADPHIQSNILMNKTQNQKQFIQNNLHKNQQTIEKQKQRMQLKNSNKDEKENKNKYNGIYQVVLDEEGKQLRTNIQKENPYIYQTHQKIYFYNKKWMALAVVVDQF